MSAKRNIVLGTKVPNMIDDDVKLWDDWHPKGFFDFMNSNFKVGKAILNCVAENTIQIILQEAVNVHSKETLIWLFSYKMNKTGN